MPHQPKIAAEYIGEGTEHLGGIPAHDLTEEEVDALPEERRADLLMNVAGTDPIYKLHTRELKAEAKDIAVTETASEVQARTASAPTTADTSPIPAPARAASKPAGADKPPADTKGGE